VWARYADTSVTTSAQSQKQAVGDPSHNGHGDGNKTAAIPHSPRDVTDATAKSNGHHLERTADEIDRLVAEHGDAA
jgi:hypothetical protein